MERMSQRASTGCALDPRGCINLESILSAFNAPISEEQAWARCYTFVQCYFDLRDEDKSKVVLSTSLKHVILHKDGYVHQDTFIPMDSQGRPIQTFPSLCVYAFSLLFISKESVEPKRLKPSAVVMHSPGLHAQSFSNLFSLGSELDWNLAVARGGKKGENKSLLRSFLLLNSRSLSDTKGARDLCCY